MQDFNLVIVEELKALNRKMEKISDKIDKNEDKVEHKIDILEEKIYSELEPMKADLTRGKFLIACIVILAPIAVGVAKLFL